MNQRDDDSPSYSGRYSLLELCESAGFDSAELQRSERWAESSRRSLRRSVHTPCSVVAEDGFRLIGTSTHDISDEGMLVTAVGEAAIGEPVFVALRIPQGRTWVDAGGTVARIENGLLAVRIHTMHPIDRAVFLGSIRRFPPLVPMSLQRPDYASHVLKLAVA